MATLGTFTAGQVLTAAELNAIGTFSTWTPTVTAETGTITSYTVVGHYTQINDLVVAQCQIVITSVGTGTNAAYVTLPVPAVTTQDRLSLGFGSETAVTGKMLQAFLVGSNAFVRFYDYTSPLGSGRKLNLTFVYRAA